VYQFRPFRNSDPPHLAAIWRSQPPLRGILQPVSPPLLELGVFSKVHFDPAGLIVATSDGVPVGFVHAGFGPNDEGTALDTSLGSTLLLMLRGGTADGQLGPDLLAQSEEYLRRKGASVLYAGGIAPLNSFYLGLYGGSEIPGILQSDQLFCEVCRQGGYREIDRVRIMQCDLIGARQPVSHKLRAVKRATELVETIDPPTTNWWDACVWSALQRDCFELRDRYRGNTLATAAFWDIQPLSACWGMCTAGLFALEVAPEHRRRGLATYLMGEAIRILRRRGVATIEAQTMISNDGAAEFYRQLGFAEIDQGIVFRRDPM
jgi:GNAT superfamily N-acetyltransferase